MEQGYITLQDVVDIAHLTLYTAFLLSIPVLLTALVVGVFISLVQTATGVQEMTLTFVPKLMAVLLVLAMALPWMATLLFEFTEETWRKMGGL